MEKKRLNFKKKVEAFKCFNCNTLIEGNGYTNHCPFCLYSKHVDKDVPGDRKNICKGEMQPIGAEKVAGTWKITHKCLKCGAITRCKISDNDNKDILISLTLDSEV